MVKVIPFFTKEMNSILGIESVIGMRVIGMWAATTAIQQHIQLIQPTSTKMNQILGTRCSVKWGGRKEMGSEKIKMDIVIL